MYSASNVKSFGFNLLAVTLFLPYIKTSHFAEFGSRGLNDAVVG